MKLTPAQAIVAVVGAMFTVLVEFDPPKVKAVTRKRKPRMRQAQRPNVRDDDGQEELPFNPMAARDLINNMFRDRPGEENSIDDMFSDVANELQRRPSPPPPNRKAGEVPLEEAMNTYSPDRSNDEEGTADTQPWLQM